MKLAQKLYDIVNVVCCVFLFGMVGIVSIVVVGRYVFSVTPGWGEELALFCMTWFGMLSAAMAEEKNAHIRISALDRYYPKPVLRMLYRFYYVVKFIFALVLIFEGLKLTRQTLPVMMSGVRMSEATIYVSGPVTGVLILIFLLCRLKQEVLQR